MCIFALGFNMFCEMRKVLFVFAALIALTACGNKQAAAPETESSEAINEVATGDTYANGIDIKELFKASKEEDSRKLKEILTNRGFVADDKQDEEDDYNSVIWKKTVYNSDRTESDTISVYWTSATIYAGREVDIVVSCKKDEIMNKWISVIKELGYSIEDVFEEEDVKRLAYSKEDDRGSIIEYDFISQEKSINILTEFDPGNEGIHSDRWW
jgi:hypothetical protein